MFVSFSGLETALQQYYLCFSVDNHWPLSWCPQICGWASCAAAVGGGLGLGEAVPAHTVCCVASGPSEDCSRPAVPSMQSASQRPNEASSHHATSCEDWKTEAQPHTPRAKPVCCRDTTQSQTVAVSVLTLLPSFPLEHSAFPWSIVSPNTGFPRICELSALLGSIIVGFP